MVGDATTGDTLAGAAVLTAEMKLLSETSGAGALARGVLLCVDRASTKGSSLINELSEVTAEDAHVLVIMAKVLRSIGMEMASRRVAKSGRTGMGLSGRSASPDEDDRASRWVMGKLGRALIEAVRVGLNAK